MYKRIIFTSIIVIGSVLAEITIMRGACVFVGIATLLLSPILEIISDRLEGLSVQLLILGCLMCLGGSILLLQEIKIIKEGDQIVVLDPITKQVLESGESIELLQLKVAYYHHCYPSLTDTVKNDFYIVRNKNHSTLFSKYKKILTADMIEKYPTDSVDYFRVSCGYDSYLVDKKGILVDECYRLEHLYEDAPSLN